MTIDDNITVDTLTDEIIEAYSDAAYQRGDLGGWNLARSSLSNSPLAEHVKLFAAMRARIVERINALSEVMVRPTARQRTLPGLIKEADKRLAAIEACAEGDWSAIDDACSWLAQHVRPDVQPNWNAHPLGTRRYDRLGFGRKE
jgi:hypothetical protein